MPASGYRYTGNSMIYKVKYNVNFADYADQNRATWQGNCIINIKFHRKGEQLITILKQDLFVLLKNNISNRLCSFAEEVGKWRQNRKKKPAIIMAARTGSIRRVK